MKRSLQSNPASMLRRARIAACAALIALAGAATGARAAQDSAVSGKTLSVFAAASLADAFGEIAHLYEAAHPGIHVQLNLAGSQQLATQIEQGAAADVFASADQRWMDYTRDRSLLADSSQVFARNTLIAIVPRTNPGRIGRLQDLTRGRLKVVIGADAVPVGHYTREVLQNLSRTDGFPSTFARRVLANVVSEEENVKSVVGKVQLGEADAGFCYRSDVTRSLKRYVRTFEIPEAANVIAAYPIAVAKGARAPDEAREFVALVLSPQGQHALEAHGLIAVASTQ